MIIRIITSCTGLKRQSVDNPLTLEDFKAGPSHRDQEVARRKLDLNWAENTYAGQQHVRLMRAVDRLRTRRAMGEKAIEPPDLWILSAGYGLVHSRDEDELIAAVYEATFQGMTKAQVRDWSRELAVPTQTREVLATPTDLALVLLGDSYWDAIDVEEDVVLGGPAFFFCGSVKARTLKPPPEAKLVVLTRQTAKRFSCGLVGLKGELAARLLLWLHEDLSQSEARLAQITADGFAGADLLDLLVEQPPTEALERVPYRPRTGAPTLFDQPTVAEPIASSRSVALSHERVSSAIDYEITLSPQWREQSQGRRIKYFIPDWDDLVDPDYNFEIEEYMRGGGGWRREVYAHQLFNGTPNYDGILVSRSVLDKRATDDKKEFLKRYGIHHYLRVPSDFPVMGDCGAFSYKEEHTPPFDTADVLAYYTDLGFDFGVSVDHLAVVADDEDVRRWRMEVTLENAASFIREHRARGLDWEPIGAVQGWAPDTYAEAARETVKMGYERIAIGGVVQTRTPDILRILEAVKDALPRQVHIHVFGVARLDAAGDFARLGVTSVDSASPLRKAWMDERYNYWTLTGERYTAIRIPHPYKSRFDDERAYLKAVEMESECLQQVRDCVKGKADVDATLDLLDRYHDLVRPGKRSRREHVERTLRDQPWMNCPCSLCKRHGIEIAIFRGNNRNRRRGFHNTFVFYELLGSQLKGISSAPSS